MFINVKTVFLVALLFANAFSIGFGTEAVVHQKDTGAQLRGSASQELIAFDNERKLGFWPNLGNLFGDIFTGCSTHVFPCSGTDWKVNANGNGQSGSLIPADTRDGAWTSLSTQSVYAVRSSDNSKIKFTVDGDNYGAHKFRVCMEHDGSEFLCSENLAKGDTASFTFEYIETPDGDIAAIYLDQPGHPRWTYYEPNDTTGSEYHVKVAASGNVRTTNIQISYAKTAV